MSHGRSRECHNNTQQRQVSVRNGLEVGRVDDILEDDRVEVHGPLVSVRRQCIAAHGGRGRGCVFLLAVGERQRVVEMQRRTKKKK